MNSAAAAVNAIRYITGSGIVAMGARTLNPAYIDKYVPVRRTLIYLRKAMTDLTQFAIFEPNDEKLWRRINASLDGFLRDFWRQGGLRGTAPAQAFFVKCDADNNPQASIDNGYVNIEVGVALQRPAEFVVIKISQFDGGTTVTVA
jgi:phage tail sheath protein FI